MEVDKSTIIRKYGVMVSALAHRMIRNKTIAEEAAQEVWFEVLKGLDSFKGKSELSTWIYTIARRTISRYAKDEYVATISQLNVFRGLPEVSYDGEEENKQEWIKERCDSCLTSMNLCLTLDARLIFTFRITVDLPYKEIAVIMEMEESTVRKIASRAIEKVRNFMKDTCSLYNPAGACKCRINKHVISVNMDKEYASIRKIVRLIDLYQRFDKELPRKNYWIKLLT